MKKSFQITIEPSRLTKQMEKGLGLFISDISKLDKVDINMESLEIVYDAEMENAIRKILDTYLPLESLQYTIN